MSLISTTTQKKKKKTNLFIYLLNNEIKRGFKQINQAKKEDAKPK